MTDEFSWGKGRPKPYVYYHGSDSRTPFKMYRLWQGRKADMFVKQKSQ